MLLDTSGLYTYLDADDHRHDQAVALLEGAPRRVTHNYVLAELVTLCQVRGAGRGAALGFSRDLLDDDAFEVLWVSPTEHRQALELLEARADKGYSLCDAVSFILMRRTGITEALTTDHHFEQEGFVKLLST